MEFYNSNMESLKKGQTNLFEKLDGLDNSSIPFNQPDEVKTIEARNKEKVLIINHASTEYRMNSPYNPTEEAIRWAEQYKIKNYNTVISIFGLGSGTFARAVLNKMDSSDILIVYEPSYKIFDYVIHNFDLTDLFEDNRVLVAIEGINDFEFHLRLLGSINIANFKSQIQCIAPNYDKLYTESCMRFFKEIKDSLTSALVNINSTIAFGEKYISNTMNNLRFLKESTSIIEIKNKIPAEVPAIVVAAGPSVEHNIEELRKAKGRAVIFAVDRILDYLLDQGIEPDFVVTIDPMKQMKHFSQRDDIAVPLICYFESNYDILKKHKGKKIFCTNNIFMEEIYHETKKTPPSLVPSGSVAIVAYSACVELGFKRVILVGQDLAFQDGASHAGGDSDQSGSRPELYIDGVDGKQVKSRYDWKEFVIRYQDLIQLNSDVEVIDAKLSGAKIKGTITMPLAEALNKFCQKPIEANVLDLDTNSFTEEELIKIRSFFEEQASIILDIEEKVEKAIKECDSLIDLHGHTYFDKKIKEGLKKLGKINSYINEQIIYKIMDPYITAKTAQYLSEILVMSDDSNENDMATFMKSKAIYLSMKDVVDFMKASLEPAITNL